MTDEEKVSVIREMTDEHDDATISIFLKMSEEIVLNRLYPYAEINEDRKWIPKYDFLQCRISAYLLNKRGAEGETSHTEGGTARTYSSADIPKDMLFEITPKAKVL